MSTVGGPTGPSSPQPAQTTDVQESKSANKVEGEKAGAADQTQSSSQTDQSNNASEQHAVSEQGERKLTSRFLQADLASRLPGAPPDGGASASTGGPSSPASHSWDIDGTGRVSQGPVSQQTIDVTKDPGFQALPQATRNSLQNEIKKDPAASARLQEVVNHQTYNQMTTEQRTKLLNVFANTGPQGREGLMPLMNRQVVIGSGDPPPTMPALLTGDNTKAQTTLLDHLDNMTRQPLAPELANRRKELLARTIQETGEPTYHLDQGVTGTCAPTTIQMHLLQHSPAEYARIIGGLSSPSHSVALANGQQLTSAQNQAGNTITKGTPPQTVADPRSITERMFQSAIQQYGDQQGNPSYKFNANTDNTGLWDNQTAHVMNGLYNRNYQYFPPGAGSTGINNATNNPAAQTALRQQLFQQVQNEINTHNGPVAVHVNWGGTSAAGNQPLHELLVERIEGGQVYFRNPWGSRQAQGAGYRDGQSLANPVRTVVDSQSGLESMPVSQFQSLINGGTIGPPVGSA